MAANLDPNMLTSPFQLTKSLHRDVYPAIDPKKTGSLAADKVIIVTGAGGGIGYVRYNSHRRYIHTNIPPRLSPKPGPKSAPKASSSSAATQRNSKA